MKFLSLAVILCLAFTLSAFRCGDPTSRVDEQPANGTSEPQDPATEPTEPDQPMVPEDMEQPEEYTVPEDDSGTYYDEDTSDQ